MSRAGTKCPVRVWLTPKQAIWVEEEAKKREMKQSEFVRQLIVEAKVIQSEGGLNVYPR